MTKRVFSSAGDHGDIIGVLPTIRHLGGGELVICERTRPLEQGGGRESMRGARYEAIKPLLEAQPYITGVRWSERPEKGHDFTDFRLNYRIGECLIDSQARHVGVQHPSTEPWLTAPRDDRYRGRVVFARTSRYPNGFYPWFALIKRYPDAVFVGLQSEHHTFEKTFRCKVEYVPTGNLLQLAGVLAASRLVCCNQSCPWWIAAGLGVTTFQETWTQDRNSMILRHNLHYMLDATFPLDQLPP